MASGGNGEESEGVLVWVLSAAGDHRGGQNLAVKLVVAVVCWKGVMQGGTQGWALAPFARAAGRRGQEGGTGPRAAAAQATSRRPVPLAALYDGRDMQRRNREERGLRCRRAMHDWRLRWFLEGEHEQGRRQQGSREGSGLAIYRRDARNPGMARTPRRPGGGRRALPGVKSSGVGRQAGWVRQERGRGGLAGLTWLRGAARGVPALPCIARLGHTKEKGKEKDMMIGTHYW
jgi:hypothetical protein